MVLTIRSTACGPRAAIQGVITATPSAKFWRSWSLSSRIRSDLVYMVESSLVDGQMDDRKSPSPCSHGRCRRFLVIAVVGEEAVSEQSSGRARQLGTLTRHPVECMRAPT